MKKVITLAFFLLTSTILAHPGRTDAKGCHNDLNTNKEHCHSKNLNVKKDKKVTALKTKNTKATKKIAKVKKAKSTKKVTKAKKAKTTKKVTKAKKAKTTKKVTKAKKLKKDKASKVTKKAKNTKKKSKVKKKVQL